MFTFRYPRGIERYIINVSNTLVDMGVDVTIITGSSKSNNNMDILDKRVKIHYIPHYKWHRFTFIPSFFLDFVKNRYDIINIFMAKGEGWAAGFTYYFKKINYNIIFQYPYEAHEKHYHAFYKFSTIHNAKKIIAVSNYVAGGIKKCFGKESCVIPNGVDVKKFYKDDKMRREGRKLLNIADDEFLLITVAALQGRKGINNVLNALPYILNNNRKVKYLVIGDGNEKDRNIFFNKVKELSLEEYVIFLGNQTNVNLFYNTSDLFLLLSKYEAFAIVVLEAMACGLPVIASKGSAFPEIVSETRGRLVDEDNPIDVSNKIIELMDNRELLNSMRKDAMEHVSKYYTWEKIAKRLIKVFEDQIEGK
jgi:glycosyltransferase involved in cell wall biosynthesis